MDKDVIVIEKHLNYNERLVLHYSEFVQEATIKIFRKSKPNVKFKTHTSYKAEITYDFFKEIVDKYVFVKNPDLQEIIDFVEKWLQQNEEDIVNKKPL